MVRTFSSAIGCQKLGQPVPDSNFVSELKSAVSQQMQRYRPLSCRFQYCPEKAISVSSWRVMAKALDESCFFHSLSLLTILGSCTTLFRSPESVNSTMVTSCGFCDGWLLMLASAGCDFLVNQKYK